MAESRRRLRIAWCWTAKDFYSRESVTMQQIADSGFRLKWTATMQFIETVRWEG